MPNPREGETSAPEAASGAPAKYPKRKPMVTMARPNPCMPRIRKLRTRISLRMPRNSRVNRKRQKTVRPAVVVMA